MSGFSKADYDYINLGVCIKNQADRLGIEHDGIPLEGVVVRIAERALRVVAEEPESMTGEIRAVEFEDGTPWPCDLDDCECPEHDTPPRREGTYLTIRLDDAFDGAGSWRVRIHRVLVEQDTENRSER